ncbi:MAG: hypothetical protein JXA54_07700 [Candidatus Heimdallarchaeota archaeon]|nr:hypothetical protein [Candidatus Heimdallarchaeota archaeon]
MSNQILDRVEDIQFTNITLPEYFFNQSFAFFCFTLVKISLDTGLIIYPSQKYIKNNTHDFFPSRTVDRYLHKMVSFGFLKKLPRNTSQSFQLLLNHPLLRLLLSIYFPNHSFFINETQSPPSNFSLLNHYKGKLSIITNSLNDLDDFLTFYANEINEDI